MLIVPSPSLQNPIDQANRSQQSSNNATFAYLTWYERLWIEYTATEWLDSIYLPCWKSILNVVDHNKRLSLEADHYSFSITSSTTAVPAVAPQQYGQWNCCVHADNEGISTHLYEGGRSIQGSWISKFLANASFESIRVLICIYISIFVSNIPIFHVSEHCVVL